MRPSLRWRSSWTIFSVEVPDGAGASRPRHFIGGMMNTRGFFGRVLADEPNHVLTLGAERAGKRIFWNKNYDTLDEMAKAAHKLDKDGLTVYHAIGSFKDNEEHDERWDRIKITRRAAQAHRFKTLACDIDVGKDKPYLTQPEAAVALAGACKAAGLMPPMVVSSGYGLHCYWPLTKVIDQPEWLGLSIALRQKLGAHGLQMDTTKVCDPSMVLRPVGTTNRKSEHPLTVQLVRDCPDYEAHALRAVLGTATATLAPRPTPGPARKSSLLDAVLTRDDLPPAEAAQLVQKCLQLAHVAATRGDVAEPIWYLSLGVANHCRDSEAVAIRWSDGHAKFDEGETVRKLQQWKQHTTGPATCAAFEKANPDVCKKCIHRGKITSPVQLSIPVADVLPGGVHMPRGYQLTNGRILRVAEGTAVPVCNFPLIVKERRFDVQTGKAIALLEARLPIEGVKEIELPIDTLAAGKDKWTAFVFNNSMAPGASEKSIAGTRQYVMTYLEELQSKSKPIDTYSHFGWQGNAFILGARRFHAEGVEEVELAQSVTNDMRNAYTSRGKLAEWATVVSLYGERGMEFHAMCFLMGLGAPLLAFTDLDGFVVSMYSPQSGTGKTTTGHLINSIWGNPKTIQIGRNDTMNAMYHTLVQQCNLPAYFEEITNIGGPELSDFVYNVAHGRERRRMSEKAVLKESGKWKLPVFTSTNRSLVAKLQNNKLSSEGELQRLIEYPFLPNEIFSGTEKGTPFGMTMAATLRDNYGLAGPEFLKAVCRIPDLHSLVANAYGALQKEFDFEFNAKERYVQAAHVIAYLAGKIGTKLGLVQFDYQRVIDRSMHHVRNTRKEVDDASVKALDVLGMFTTEHTGSTVYERTDTSAPRPQPIHNSTNLRGDIRARFEIVHNGKGSMSAGAFYVDRAYFNKWCQERGIDATDVVANLKSEGVNVNVLRISLGRRTSFMTSAVYCYHIELMHPEFAARLSGVDAARESLLLGVPGAKVAP